MLKSCPHCNQQLDCQGLSGKVTCPTCSNEFIVSGPPPPPLTTPLPPPKPVDAPPRQLTDEQAAVRNAGSWCYQKLRAGGRGVWQRPLTAGGIAAGLVIVVIVVVCLVNASAALDNQIIGVWQEVGSDERVIFAPDGRVIIGKNGVIVKGRYQVREGTWLNVSVSRTFENFGRTQTVTSDEVYQARIEGDTLITIDKRNKREVYRRLAKTVPDFGSLRGERFEDISSD